jgi:hypothetical protein
VKWRAASPMEHGSGCSIASQWPEKPTDAVLEPLR